MMTKNIRYALPARLGKLSVIVVIMVLSSFAFGQRSYTTPFPASENPISESGNWINGGVAGLDWHNCRTTSGFVFGTEPATTNYDDSTCLVTGVWGADQQAEGTVHIASADSTQSEEVEIRLRSSISAHHNVGYEINCSVKSGNPYMQIVKWNGALGNFTLLDARTVGCANGDILKATISGTNPATITAYKNGSAIFSVHDSASPYTSGQPGMGFYIQNGSSTTNANFGFSKFTATDTGTAGGGTPPAPPTNLQVVVR